MAACQTAFKIKVFSNLKLCQEDNTLPSWPLWGQCVGTEWAFLTSAFREKQIDLWHRSEESFWMSLICGLWTFEILWCESVMICLVQEYQSWRTFESVLCKDNPRGQISTSTPRLTKSTEWGGFCCMEGLCKMAGPVNHVVCSKHAAGTNLDE